MLPNFYSNRSFIFLKVAYSWHLYGVRFNVGVGLIIANTIRTLSIIGLINHFSLNPGHSNRLFKHQYIVITNMI